MTKGMEERGSTLENEYFHRKEKELIEKMKTKLAAEEAHATALKCPRCADGVLIETEFEHIHIDVCDKCSGAWFDATELTQIVDKSKGGWLKRFFG